MCPAFGQCCLLLEAFSFAVKFDASSVASYDILYLGYSNNSFRFCHHFKVEMPFVRQKQNIVRKCNFEFLSVTHFLRCDFSNLMLSSSSSNASRSVFSIVFAISDLCVKIDISEAF